MAEKSLEVVWIAMRWAAREENFSDQEMADHLYEAGLCGPLTEEDIRQFSEAWDRCREIVYWEKTFGD